LAFALGGFEKILYNFGESNKTFASSLTKIIKNIQKKQIKQ
jgi:hypothetical protein